MDAPKFFHYIAKQNYVDSLLDREDLRLLWNAVVSMNTVPEYVALHQLDYELVSRNKLDDAANGNTR